MNVDNVKVGMKFSTLNKLAKEIGIEFSRNVAQKDRQLNEISRYLLYEKTGKISRGKETNEIVITEIFETPLEKEDGRVNNGRKPLTGEFNQPLSNILGAFNSGTYTIPSIMRMCGLIENKNVVSTYKEYDGDIKTYKYQFKKHFRNSLASALSGLEKKYGYDSFDFDFTFLIQLDKYDKFDEWVECSKEEKEQIIIIEESTKKHYEELHGLSWNRILFNGEIYEQYLKDVTYKVCNVIGVYNYCPAASVRNGLENKIEFAMLVSDSIDELRDVYSDYMETLIYSYRYEIKPKNGIATFGRTANLGKWIYKLKDKKPVWDFHNKVFKTNCTYDEKKFENIIMAKYSKKDTNQEVEVF